MGSRDQSSKRRRVLPKKASFSDVADDVARRIISSIPIKDLGRFGCVSKRCRQLQLSTQSLNFNGFFDKKPFTCEQRSKLLECLDGIFIQRIYDYIRNHNNLQSFRFSWVDHYENQQLCRDNVLGWIYFAATCKVEVLHLDITIPASARTALGWEFPSDFVFEKCPLRSLYMNRRFTVFRTPSLTCFSNLECLELIEVSIADEELFKWISNCCRCIKNLKLHNVRGIDSVSIQSSSLKSIYIRCYNPECLFSVSLSCEELEYISIGVLCRVSEETLCISAPNLKYLTWGGCFLNLQNVGEFLSLKKVLILYPPCVLVNDIENVENAIDNLCKHLWSIRMVKFLHINSDFIECLYQAGTAAPLACCHLKILLSENFTNKMVPALVSLLKGMPNLKYLHIEDLERDPYSKSDSSAFKMLYWKLQYLVFVHQLKEVSIMLAGGSNGIMFARYILENAPHLEKMVIYHLAEQSNAVRELKSGMVSNASLVFHQR